MSDIVELILAEHARICWLVEELDKALTEPGRRSPGPDPLRTWAALADVLESHIDAAGEICYGALTTAEPGAAPAIGQASDADADIREAIREARLSRPGSQTWRMAVSAARTAALNHVSSLDPDSLDRFRQRTALPARRALGRQWVAFMAARALDASPAPRRDSAGRAAAAGRGHRLPFSRL